VLSARLQSDARSLLARFLSEASVAIIPFGESHYSAAVDAWLRYGKGKHPAALNFGD
jgi:ribonuclease VapC